MESVTIDRETAGKAAWGPLSGQRLTPLLRSASVTLRNSHDGRYVAEHSSGIDLLLTVEQ
jgi:hypothetical protein